MKEPKIQNMKKKNYMSWDTYFMSIAILSSFKSKDANTQNGACIVDPEKKIIGIGYNGMPRGVNEEDPQYWNDDDNDVTNSRHTYVVHAEKNAIFNSINHDLRGGTLYSKQFPCNVCAQAIIQVGLKKVVWLNIKEHSCNHKKRNDAVRKMFKDTGIEVIKYSDLKIKDKNWIEKLEDMNKKFYKD